MNGALHDSDQLCAADRMMCRCAIGLAIVGLLITGVTLLSGLLVDVMHDDHGRLIAVGALCTMAGAGLLALYSAQPYRGGRVMRVIGTILLVLAASGWLIVVAAIGSSDEIRQTALNIVAVTVCMVGVIVVHRCEATGGTSVGMQAARWAVRISWFVLAILVTIGALWPNVWASESFAWSVPAAAAAGVFSAALLSLLHKIESNAGSADVGALPASMTFRFACPGCGESLAVLPGRMTTCTSCRMPLRIEIEEPRCTCGYLIYRLQSDTCPECGALISVGQRWLDGPTDEDQVAGTPQRRPSSTDDSAMI